MNHTYQNPASIASFGGIDALYRAADGKVPKKVIQKWLEGVDAYTLHKPVRHKFQTNRVIVYALDQQWQTDLVDMQNLQKFNDGYRYILTCIDVLSKYAWAVPLKRKTGGDTVKAFQDILKNRQPQFLQSDKGTEYKNSVFQKFLKEKKIKFFTTNNATKASIIERFHRTLRTKMWKYFTSQNTYRYIDVLQDLIKSYNHTYHRSIKRAPSEVTLENEQDVWFALYGGDKRPPPKCVFNDGDTVRISRKKLTFEKGYETNWTEEIFIVTECVKRQPAVYRIKDLLGEPIEGTFYQHELQKVSMKDTYRIEKVLKKRMRKNKTEYFVKYRGYPNKFNQWISASNFLNI